MMMIAFIYRCLYKQNHATKTQSLLESGVPRADSLRFCCCCCFVSCDSFYPDIGMSYASWFLFTRLCSCWLRCDLCELAFVYQVVFVLASV